jgi:Fuc2NAc and GlcNAc transferase
MWLSGSIAALVSWLALRGVERHASAVGLIDRPNERSSHVHPRPRGGGIGIILGTAAGVGVAALTGISVGREAATVLGAAVIVAGVGLWDDVSTLPAGPRFVVHTVAAALVVSVCGGFATLPLPPPLDLPVGVAGTVLAVIWIVGVTNFFNFMDGADGLAAGQAAITLAALGYVMWPSPVAGVPVVAMGAVLAFLMRNWSPARIFLGDVGSGWMGFLLAALPLAVPSGGEGLVWLVATSLALFLVDPTLTLARRWRRGVPLTTSHREHAYQRLFRPGTAHAAPVTLLLLAGASVTLPAVLAFEHQRGLWASGVWALCVCAAEWMVAGRVMPSGKPGQ